MLGSDVVIDLAFGVDFQSECIRARTTGWIRLPTAPPSISIATYLGIHVILSMCTKNRNIQWYLKINLTF